MADAKTEKQKVKEITDKLEEGLKELFNSEKYKSYLSTMSKFHNYSVNNTLLIALQRPDASLVAGYQAWQRNFNRHVNKGERGIRILAPAPYKIKEERDKLDPVTGEVMLDKDGIDHPADYKGHSLSVSDIVVLHEDGKNSAHFVDSFGFTGLPDFMRELEGIEEPEKGETEPEAPQEETLDTSGHNVQKSDVEKTEQKSYPAFYGHTLVYAMEHGEVDRYLDSRKFDRECKDAIEETIRQNFDGMHLNHDIVKPLAEQYGSDLDVVVELSTSEREDVLFDTFNGDALHIGGVKVDINPITAQRTGTLETYLPQVEDYLEGVREAREKESVSLSQEQAETEVTLTVAEWRL